MAKYFLSGQAGLGIEPFIEPLGAMAVGIHRAVERETTRSAARPRVPAVFGFIFASHRGRYVSVLRCSRLRVVLQPGALIGVLDAPCQRPVAFDQVPAAIYVIEALAARVCCHIVQSYRAVDNLFQDINMVQ